MPMLLKKTQVNYYMNGRKILNQSGEADIQTIEANKAFLEKMFSIFYNSIEIEVIAEPITDSRSFSIPSPYLN
tara:strand:+ start:125 stop:343 length:219 start_codon:yes stop_codon:yes gene_type:complete